MELFAKVLPSILILGAMVFCVWGCLRIRACMGEYKRSDAPKETTPHAEGEVAGFKAGDDGRDSR